MVLQMTHEGYAAHTLLHHWAFTYIAKGSSPPAVSSPLTPPLDSLRLAAFPLGNRNTSSSGACPCHPLNPLTHPITFKIDLLCGVFLSWQARTVSKRNIILRWQRSTAAWETHKSRAQLPSPHSSSLHRTMHFLTSHHLCLAPVKHLN